MDRSRLAHRAELLLAAVAVNIALTAGLLTTFIVAFARAGRPRVSADAGALLAGAVVAVAFGVQVLRIARSRARPRGSAASSAARHRCPRR